MMAKDTDFQQSFAERAWDTIQLAQINALEDCLIDYATNAWRDINKYEPPIAVPILAIGAPGEGVIILVKTQSGDWRTNLGQPHKGPTLWMPCPELPVAPEIKKKQEKTE